MSKKTGFKKNVVAAGAFALASVAFAGDAKAITLTFGGWEKGYRNVDVTYPNHDGAAGGYIMKEVGNLTNSFIVFCLDLLAEVRSGNHYEYKVTATPFSNSQDTLTTAEISRIQKLFDTGYDDAFDSSVKSAGFQVALWNAIYDTDWNVTNTSSSFYQIDTSSGVQAAANGFLSAAQGYMGPSKFTMTFLEGSTNSPRSQNLVTVDPVPGDSTTPVPLPAAAWMLLTALGGLAFLRRRGQTAV